VRTFLPTTLLAAALFSAVVVLPFLPFAHTPYHAEVLTLEITQISGAGDYAQLFYDVGRGFNEKDSSRAPVAGTGRPEQIRLTFPLKDCRALRYDPVNAHCDLTILQAEIRYADGGLALRLKPADFAAGGDIAALTIDGNSLHLRLVPDGTDPSVLLTAELPGGRLFRLARIKENLAALWWRAALVLAGTLGLVRLGSLAVVGRGFSASCRWAADRPGQAVALVALGAVLASTYPVVLLDQSFVSPNLGTSLLYESTPSLPGMRDSRMENPMGSDVGAMMWSFVPATAVQHEAVVEHHELPLWNRYNSGGVTLLGQGQSMFGDPLHFLPLLGNSAAWTWDAKFVIAKWLFALGLGLCVLAATRHLPAALLVAMAAPFLGFFVFRLNHSAFFSLCYAPWVLYCWLRFDAAPHRRAGLGWLGGLILANGCLLTSGTVKEAYMLLLCLNATGALIVIAASAPWADRFRRLAAALGAGVVFLLISSPVWLNFLAALLKAHTSYDHPAAYQLQPGLLLAFFDELFYRPISDRLLVFRPGMNFVFLSGLACFLATLREHFRDRAIMAIATATLVPVALVYGLIPPAWIVAVPFLGNVTHVDNTFICVLIVLVAVLAGAGFSAVAQRLGTPESRGDLLIAALLVLAPVGLYLGFLQAVHRNSYGPGLIVMPTSPDWGGPVPPFIWGYLWSILASLAAGAVVIRRAIFRGFWTPAGALLLLTCLVVLLWRQGMHLPTGFDEYVVNPPARADLHAPSAAVRFVRQDRPAGPFRVAGFGDNLYAGWNDMDRIEAVSGPDPIVNRQYNELVNAFNLVPVGDWHPYFTPENLPTFQRYLDALNVRYYVQLPGQPGPALPRVQQADLNVYESPGVWPRAFFTNHAVVYDTAADFARLIREGDGRPFAALQANDVPDHLAGLLTTPPAAARFAADNYQLSPNETSFAVQADGPGVIVLTEAWYRDDFQARLDGRPVPYFRVNHAFKGIYVESPGRHRVSFRYWPEHLTLSLWLATIGVGIAIVAAVQTLRRTQS
jgi:hypothetical protein